MTASDPEEQHLRAALALRPRDVGAASALASHLLSRGSAEAALEVTGRLAPASNDPFLLDAHANALVMTGRRDLALVVRRRIAKSAPGSVSAHHNLGSILGDLLRHEEAEAEARRALALGGQAPETWLVLGHALQGQGKLEEAEAAYRTALQGRPDFADAHADLAQLLWMRTENITAAIELLDQAIHSGAMNLLAVRARLREFAGDLSGALDDSMAAARAFPTDASVQLAAALHALAAHNPERALVFDEAAARIDGDGDRSGVARVSALLALGRIEQAARDAEALHARAPNEQMRIALLATAWRMLGDARYSALYDYERFVRAWTIDTPKGWRNLASYLADLTVGLAAMHTARTHPVGQSLRHGSQTGENLLTSKHPAVAAFPKAIDGPIRAHMAAVGKGEGPLRSRNTGGYSIAGIWSVRLRPNGFHIDHVHPQGWLSSACYIDLPPAVGAGGREGWIKFGEPGVDTLPELEPEHFVKPEPGLLVLFPSYMWHGTVPFSGEASRLTVAFDLLPKS